MGNKNRKNIPQKNKVRAELQKEIDCLCPFCDNDDVGHFEIHHIDEDPSNNENTNLILICPTCHSKITKGDISKKEVAQRICEKEGSKTYGILSVLVQAFYDAEYLFTVPPSVFNPPPKVESGVLRLTRKENYKLPCDEDLLFKVVKTAFQQRRKTLRNSLKTLNLSDNLREDVIFDKRPEQLNVSQFIALTTLISQDLKDA